MQLNSHFQGLLSNIEPDDKAVAKAKKSHEDLRAILQNDPEISKADPDTYLSGSYARNTATNYIKDVDVILLVNLDSATTTPHVAVAWVQASLQEHYSEVIPQGRSVQVKTDSGFELDVVPSIPIGNRNGPILVPDRDVKNWVASHPKGQIAFGVQKNQDTNGYYKPLVKIMKFWRDRFSGEEAKVKSYILENLVGENLTAEPASYGAGVLLILQNIYQKYATYLANGFVPRITDLGYPSVNVAKRWKFNEFTAFMEEVRKGQLVAGSALRSQDEQESVRLWRQLFGMKFEVK
ncbi:MAG: nucleotidyltransferase [Candidatus Omnitrophota bacterium]|nr:nucleotidyltransferase [Candidatus Omnitrophota bacterium]